MAAGSFLESEILSQLHVLITGLAEISIYLEPMHRFVAGAVGKPMVDLACARIQPSPTRWGAATENTLDEALFRWASVSVFSVRDDENQIRLSGWRIKISYQYCYPT